MIFQGVMSRCIMCMLFMINICTISLFQEENLDQILKIIGDLKEIGNKLYKDKDFKKAKLKYKKAIRFVYKLAKIKSI